MEPRRKQSFLMGKKLQQATGDGNTENFANCSHPIVAAISQLEFQGSLIPHSWWHSEELRFSNGQPNYTAMLILADICYWYRGTEKRDTSGKVVELRPKFAANMLQKSYKEWAEQYGLNKRQIQDAATFLVDRGLINKELRSFENRGVMLYNVTFFEPVPAAIRELTLSRPDVTPHTSERDTSHPTTGHPIRGNVIPITSGRDTYTETRQENNSKNRQREGSVCVAPATPAGADTHTPLAFSPSAGKKSKKAVKEEVIQVTPDQQAVFDIFTAFFPSLVTRRRRLEFTRYVTETRFSPWGAAVMCAWIESTGRNYRFMEISFFDQLREEFNLSHDEETEYAKQYLRARCGEKLKKVMAIHDEWYEKYGKEE